MFKKKKKKATLKTTIEKKNEHNSLTFKQKIMLDRLTRH